MGQIQNGRSHRALDNTKECGGERSAFGDEEIFLFGVLCCRVVGANVTRLERPKELVQTPVLLLSLELPYNLERPCIAQSFIGAQRPHGVHVERDGVVPPIFVLLSMTLGSDCAVQATVILFRSIRMMVVACFAARSGQERLVFRPGSTSSLGAHFGLFCSHEASRLTDSVILPVTIASRPIEATFSC